MTIARRDLLLGSAAFGCAALSGAPTGEEVIDFHQHTNYSGRADDALVAHQETLGATRTVLLPAGSRFGLDADCGGNDSVLALARRYPQRFVFFANELPDLPEARSVIERYLKQGACGIGEQKFRVDSDSPHIDRLAELAREYGVPILLHFQHETYNTAFERFHKVLARYPRVNFIGHAQTWWGNIDARHEQAVLYPQGKVTRGGLTDKWLADYPNIYGDLSARSGLQALTRDEDHAREFLLRHQDRLLYASDCNDAVGSGNKCSGAQALAVVRRLVPEAQVRRKILAGNARRLLKL